jgi:CCR4-NOT transcription complex subunit 3
VLACCRAGLNEIKDKTALSKARKDIEAQMERFKICEKETKTKAFSKEGLGQAAKLDPREAARKDMENWIATVTERLNTEVFPKHRR